MLDNVVALLLTIVTCKETHAAIIALHKKDFVVKDIAACKIASKSIIYGIINNLKEREV